MKIINYRNILNFERSFLLLMIFIGILQAIVLGNKIYSNREIPLEVDEAYQYQIHSELLINPEKKEMALWKSLEFTKEITNHKNFSQFEQTRQHHRIIDYYHNGHAVLLAAFKVVGGDPDSIGIFLTYITLLLTYLSCLLVFSNGENNKFILVYGAFVSLLSIYYIRHTVVSAAFIFPTYFFACLFYFLNYKFTGKRIYEYVLLFGLSLLMLSFHKVGFPLLILVYTSLLGWKVYNKNNENLFKIIVCFLLTILTNSLVFSYLGMTNEASTAVHFSFSNVFIFIQDLVKLGSFVIEPISPWFLFGSLKYLGLLFYFLIFIFYIRSFKLNLASIMWILIFLGQFVFSTSFRDFKPGQKLFLGEYLYFPHFLILLAATIQLGNKCLANIKYKNILYILMMILIILGGAKYIGRYKINIIDRYSNRFDYKSPKVIIGNIDEYTQKLNGDNCVIVHDEELLYALLIFSNYSFKVSYKGMCDSKFHYQNLKENCSFYFGQKNEYKRTLYDPRMNCVRNFNFEIIKESDGYIFAKIIQNI